ncbi:MerR family transcriptional regulator [Goodfellowiella coeruleoviolacea]|uniref:DNA-binding transcriptional regulator, MerR family n=1 Tax=Goodfellowiella coeruleoviolacea TaxID=334858 RepID=A0AAE3KGP6_9PSEU|nr:MerR family transcriptional regulator [Goodfellowiella coeruleoviolacea]MCP2166430.1 DNA-binding transcriptional regulator, MerR family [Goodfellowiella coeruleoviolacea]
MLIGELARRTGTSERLLRYYERVGLLAPWRRDNGYREYDADAEHVVRRVRALLAAGLPTRVIRQVLPCASGDGQLRPCPGVLDTLHRQLSELDEQARRLDTARQVLRAAIRTTERRRAPDAEAPDPGAAGAPR